MKGISPEHNSNYETITVDSSNCACRLSVAYSLLFLLTLFLPPPFAYTFYLTFGLVFLLTSPSTYLLIRILT